MSQKTHLRIGVDLGGTKIEAIALERDGREALRKRVLTPRGDYAATVAAIAALVQEIGDGAVGIGIPGALSRLTGLVKNANSTWLIGRPLKEDLSARSGARCASKTMPTALRSPRQLTARARARASSSA